MARFADVSVFVATLTAASLAVFTPASGGEPPDVAPPPPMIEELFAGQVTASGVYVCGGAEVRMTIETRLHGGVRLMGYSYNGVALPEAELTQLNAWLKHMKYARSWSVRCSDKNNVLRVVGYGLKPGWGADNEATLVATLNQVTLVDVVLRQYARE